MVQMAFNATQFDPSIGGGDVFETGTYAFQIVSSQAKPTKRGDGHMLVFEAVCIDGPNTGRRLSIRLNLWNPNAQAVEIANRELSAISHAVGLLHWQDTQELHGRPFKMQIEKLPRNDDPTKFGNEVRGYFDAWGNAPSAGASPAQAMTAPQAPPQPQAQPMQAPPQQAPVAAAPAGFAPTPAPAAPAPWQSAATGAPDQQPQQGQAPWQTAQAPAPAPAPAPAAVAAPVAAPAPTTAPAPVAAPPWQAGQVPPAGANPPWMTSR